MLLGNYLEVTLPKACTSHDVMYKINQTKSLFFNKMNNSLIGNSTA